MTSIPVQNPTFAIIQARMSSSRLPGKVLLDIARQPMLVHVIERTRRAKMVDVVAVATTTEPSDDQIAALCAERGYPCYRGSLHDVLDRYYQAAKAFGAARTPGSIIVRITADCPLIDPDLIDHTLRSFLGAETHPVPTASGESAPLNPIPYPLPYDFAANRLPPPWGRTYPIGLDVEVCTFEGLETVWKEARELHQREHVMPFFYEHPERFRILHLNHSEDYGSMRWTVDTADDLELVRQIFARFPGRTDFTWLDVLDLFKNDPSLAQINAQVKPKDYRQIDDRQITPSTR